MKGLSAGVVAGALTAFAEQGVHKPAASVGSEVGGREPTHVRGTVLAVHKKLPDGSWKVFRAMGLSD